MSALFVDCIYNPSSLYKSMSGTIIVPDMVTRHCLFSAVIPERIPKAHPVWPYTS